MADKRMFSQKIIDSDAFLDMPLSTQALYFHLSMRADDEGFINNPKKIQKMIGASDDDVKVLVAKNFVIPFESGVVVIKHWKIHNYIRADRLQATPYSEEKAMLDVKENGAYTRCQSNVSQVSVTCPSNVSIDKISIDKNSIDNNGAKTKRFKPPTLDEVREYCKERKNNVNPEQFVDFYTANGWKVGKNSMKDWKASVRTWERNHKDDKPKQAEEIKPKRYEEFEKEEWERPDFKAEQMPDDIRAKLGKVGKTI